MPDVVYKKLSENQKHKTPDTGHRTSGIKQHQAPDIGHQALNNIGHRTSVTGHQTKKLDI